MARKTKTAKIDFEINDEESGIIDDGNGVRSALIKEFDLNNMHPIDTNDLKSASKIVVIGKPKCFALGTKCMLYTGESKNVEDIMPGDILMGDDSTPRTVLQTCKGRQEMFDIIFVKQDTCIEKYTVNLDHILVLACIGYKGNEKGSIIEISVKDYLEKDQDWKNSFRLLKAKVEFNNENSNKLPLDPYTLGTKLGEMILADMSNNIDKRTEYDDYFGKINNRHIPLIYKANSSKNRLELLAGLLDINGNCDYKSYHILCNNEQLINDIIWLARSLGFAAYKELTGLYLYGDIKSIPCKYHNKQLQENTYDVLLHKFTVSSIGEGNYYGFTLDGNHRFLSGSFDILRNTGKSTLIENIMLYKSHICPIAQIASGTEQENGFYKRISTDTTIFDKFDMKCTENFIKRQKIARQYLPNPWALKIDDDVTDDPTVMKKPLMQGMFKRGRHWNMIYILALQYPMDIPTAIRSCVDYVFILSTNILSDRKRIYENLPFGSLLSFQDFCDILDGITEDHTALVLDNMVESNKIEDRLFYFKADPTKVPKDWKFGSQDAWDCCEERMDPNYTPSIL